MDAIKVNKTDLLAKVKSNRAAHRQIFEEALEGYRRAAIVELESMLADAKANRKIRRSVQLVEPMDQTEDYDRIIAMLEMSQDDVIELTETDFSCYVLDNWRWKHQFMTSNSTYSVSAARLS